MTLKQWLTLDHPLLGDLFGTRGNLANVNRITRKVDGWTLVLRHTRAARRDMPGLRRAANTHSLQSAPPISHEIVCVCVPDRGLKYVPGVYAIRVKGRPLARDLHARLPFKYHSLSSTAAPKAAQRPLSKLGRRFGDR